MPISREKARPFFIFYITDASRIAEDQNPGQKALLVLAEPQSGSPSEIVQKEIQEANIPQNIFSDEFTIDDEAFRREYKGW